VLNPGETIDLTIRLQNSGSTSAVTGINAQLSTPMAGVSIVNGTTSYPTIAVGANAAPAQPFRIHVGAVFNGEPIPFYVNTNSSAGPQVIRVDYTPAAGDVTFAGSTFIDSNSRLDPGDIGDLTTTFTNSGAVALNSAGGILRSLDWHVVVNDSVGTFGTVSPAANSTNSADHFNVSASSQTVGGYQALMELVIYDANGFRDSVDFYQTVGVAGTNTPTGPDAYGYYAYDNTETLPGGTASTYAWTEICPGLGGQGTTFVFTDSLEDRDQSSVRTLPFTFRYYGQNFTQVTVCTNGWLAFGDRKSVV
jgi:hypothetical protein